MTIKVRAGGWSASGRRLPDDIAAIVADPSGWKEVSGPSWLADEP